MLSFQCQAAPEGHRSVSREVYLPMPLAWQNLLDPEVAGRVTAQHRCPCTLDPGRTMNAARKSVSPGDQWPSFVVESIAVVQTYPPHGYIRILPVLAQYL